MANSIEDVQLWMEKVGFGDYYKAFEEAEIDGEALQCLTERALELLIPRMGPRMKFIKILEALKHPVQQVEDSPPEFIAPTCSVHEATCPDNPEANKSSYVAVVTSPSGSSHVFNAKKLWPSVVTLPKTFRPELARVLNSGNEKDMTGKLRKALILRLFEHFSTFTLYPTREQLTQVCQKLIKDYPFLKDKCLIGSGHDSWFAQIYEKFRNERKTMRDPEVLSQKRKAVDGKKKVPKSLKRGGLNWEPAFPEGEDELSMKCHRDTLKTEWKKKNPEIDNIRNRMEITFADRRQMINQKRPLAIIQEEYPALFSYSQIINEFERILYLTSSVVTQFKMNFAQMVQGIIDVSRRKSMQKCQNSEQIKAFLSLLDSTAYTSGQCLSDEVADIAMVVLPFLLQAKSGKSPIKDFVEFLSEEESFDEIVTKRTSMAPKILVRGELSKEKSPDSVVIAEDVIVCKVNGSLVDATIALMATIYVFMLEYPTPLKNVFLFLQKCVLQIQDGKKLPSSVITLMNELNSK